VPLVDGPIDHKRTCELVTMDISKVVTLYVPPSPPTQTLGQAVFEFVLLLDRTLVWLWVALSSVPETVFLVSLDFLGLLALNGVFWFERCPWFFWFVWLPLVVATYVQFLLWAKAVFFRFAVLLWKLVFRRLVLGWLLELAAAWLLRGSLSPPSVLRSEVIVDVSLSGSQLAQARGIAFAQAANVAHASVTAGGLTPTRHRKRAVWTNRLQAYLGGRPGAVGDLIRGRWTPDLPSDQRPASVNALLGLADLDVKLLGGGVLPTGVYEHEVFIVVDTSLGRLVIAPALLAKLSLYSCFRPRTPDLLSGLRARAREWFSEKGVADLASAFVLPDTVMLAFKETVPERMARERLDEFEDPPSQ